MTTPTARPRKTAAAKSAAHFSIAVAEREADTASEQAEVFTVNLRPGRDIRLHNLADLDWAVAASLDDSDPISLLKAVVYEEDWEDFAETKFRVSTLRTLIESWRDFYQVLTPGE